MSRDIKAINESLRINAEARDALRLELKEAQRDRHPYQFWCGNARSTGVPDAWNGAIRKAMAAMDSNASLFINIPAKERMRGILNGMIWEPQDDHEPVMVTRGPVQRLTPFYDSQGKQIPIDGNAIRLVKDSLSPWIGFHIRVMAGESVYLRLDLAPSIASIKGKIVPGLKMAYPNTPGANILDFDSALQGKADREFSMPVSERVIGFLIPGPCDWYIYPYTT